MLPSNGKTAKLEFLNVQEATKSYDAGLEGWGFDARRKGDQLSQNSRAIRSPINDYIPFKQKIQIKQDNCTRKIFSKAHEIDSSFRTTNFKTFALRYRIALKVAISSFAEPDFCALHCSPSETKEI